jgi:hypothetical protein
MRRFCIEPSSSFNNTQVVFLTDALSVLQAVMNDNLPQLEQALYTINTPRTVVQRIVNTIFSHLYKRSIIHVNKALSSSVKLYGR